MQNFEKHELFCENMNFLTKFVNNWPNPSGMEKPPRPCYTDFKLLARGPRLSNLLETASKRGKNTLSIVVYIYFFISVGYERIAVDVEVSFESKKTVIPRVEELDKALKECVTLPEGVCAEI